MIFTEIAKLDPSAQKEAVIGICLVLMTFIVTSAVLWFKMNRSKS